MKRILILEDEPLIAMDLQLAFEDAGADAVVTVCCEDALEAIGHTDFEGAVLDVNLGKGLKVPDVCKQLRVSEQTDYRWRTKYGGMDPQMAKQLREMEKENSRLKKVVADQALDIQILKEAARPN